MSVTHSNIKNKFNFLRLVPTEHSTRFVDQVQLKFYNQSSGKEVRTHYAVQRLVKRIKVFVKLDGEVRSEKLF